jgi:Protein of unknown function (DUF3485)
MRYLLLTLAFAAVLIPGLVHGLWTGRWGDSEQLERSAARLSAVPSAFGDWKGEDLPIDERQNARSELTRTLTRVYRNRTTGQEIVIFLGCGRPGPVSLHTPDVCYVGAGCRMTGPEQRQTFAQKSAKVESEFKTAMFVKPTPVGEQSIQVYWSWTADGAWHTPDAPRLSFGREPALYKLYVQYTFTGDAQRLTDAQRKELDAGFREFMNVFLPELQRALFAPDPRTAA